MVCTDSIYKGIAGVTSSHQWIYWHESLHYLRLHIIPIHHGSRHLSYITAFLSINWAIIFHANTCNLVVGEAIALFVFITVIVFITINYTTIIITSNFQVITHKFQASKAAITFVVIYYVNLRRSIKNDNCDSFSTDLT